MQESYQTPIEKCQITFSHGKAIHFCVVSYLLNKEFTSMLNKLQGKIHLPCKCSHFLELMIWNVAIAIGNLYNRYAKMRGIKEEINSNFIV